jgi:signal recognition particle subunit SRP54
MFAKLTERLGKAVEALRGRGRLTEENIAESLREVRMALLEADVALPVVKRFIDAVKAKAVGAEVVGSLTPGQALIGVIHDELVAIMGGKAQPFDLRHAPPAVILLAGLQGAGKTTTAGKLARLLIGQKKRVLLVSTDIRRPAAVLQLQRLAEQVGANFHPVEPGAAPAKIATSALDAARRGVFDVLIVDTAGRLHIDAELMQEVRDIDQAVSPHERLFVVDAMAGQDAVNAAKAFGEALQLTGTILTKADGDARGGAALSVREITGKPAAVHRHVGEKSDALEPFDPDRMARPHPRHGRRGRAGRAGAGLGRCRGSPEAGAEGRQGQGLRLQRPEVPAAATAEDGRHGRHSRQAARWRGRGEEARPGVAEKELKRQIALIDSMTPRERRRPEIIDGSRRRRIAAGSGMQVQDVNRLLKQHLEMQRMMKKLGGGKLARMMGAMAGKMPGMPR